MGEIRMWSVLTTHIAFGPEDGNGTPCTRTMRLNHDGPYILCARISGLNYCVNALERNLHTASPCDIKQKCERFMRNLDN